MIVSAISAFLIDRRFKTAAIWCIIACVTTLIGFHHAYRVEPGQFSLSPQELLVWQRTEPSFAGTNLQLKVPEGTYLHRGYRIAAGYASAAALLLVIDVMRRRRKGFEDIDVDMHGSSPSRDSGVSSLPRAPADVAKLEQNQATDPDIQRSEGEGMVIHPVEPKHQD
jgi:hypothetical protein